MSTVGVSWGRASSSSQVQRFGSFTLPIIEKSHCSRGVCGVGPAESTGKPRSRYCPGGSRPATSPCWRRPRKAREMNPSLMLCLSIPYEYISLPYSSPSSCIMHHYWYRFKVLSYGYVSAWSSLLQDGKSLPNRPQCCHGQRFREAMAVFDLKLSHMIR